MKKILFVICLLFIFIGGVNAQNLNPNVDISEEGYEKLSKFMSEAEMGIIDQKTYNMFMERNVIAYQSYIVETTFVSSFNSLPKKVSERIMSVDEFASLSTTDATCKFYENVDSYGQVCETNMKYMILSISDLVDNIQFTFQNSWKSTPKYKSFDVMAIRWGNNFNMLYYMGEQITDGNTKHVSYDEGNGNFKISTNAVGLSQNLVDSATNIDNKLYVVGTCTTGGTVYASYQHAQANITLATSKKYNFSSSGMGGVFKFYDGVGSYYDNTPGLELNYTC